MELSYDETIIELKLCIEFVVCLRPAILVFYLYVIIRDYNRVLVFFISNLNTLFRSIVGRYLFEGKKKAIL